MAEFRVLITGSRDWPDAARIHGTLTALADQCPEGLVVVHGDARSGADRLASDWARTQRNAGRKVAEEAHPADWARHGGWSGLKRNAEMVALGADLCLAYIVPCAKPYCRRPQPHGSHGASDCAERADESGHSRAPVHANHPGRGRISLVTITEPAATGTAIPDLRDIPEDQLARLGNTALAHAIRLCRERLAGNDAPPRTFNSGI